MKYINNYIDFINEEVFKERQLELKYGLKKFTKFLTKIIDEKDFKVWKINISTHNDKLISTIANLPSNTSVKDKADTLKSHRGPIFLSYHVGVDKGYKDDAFDYLDDPITQQYGEFVSTPDPEILGYSDKFELIDISDYKTRLDLEYREFGAGDEDDKKIKNSKLKKYKNTLIKSINFKDIEHYFKRYIDNVEFDYIDEDIQKIFDIFPHINYSPLFKMFFIPFFKNLDEEAKHWKKQKGFEKHLDSLYNLFAILYNKFGKPLESLIIKNAADFPNIIKYFPDKIRKELEHIEGLNDIGLF
jgi:hypothetical protein